VLGVPDPEGVRVLQRTCWSLGAGASCAGVGAADAGGETGKEVQQLHPLWVGSKTTNRQKN